MSTSGNDYNYLFKILLIGNSSVGKSSLLVRFVEDKWSDTFVPTIGVDFKIKSLDIDQKQVKLQIWDTAGQERFKNITAAYYRGAHGILVVYDITDVESFKNLSTWLIEIEKNANKNVVKILIGNKNDMESERKVSYQQGKSFADTYGMNFIETSAKSNNNVDHSFELLAREIIKLTGADKEKAVTEKKKNFNIQGNSTDINAKKKGCC